MTTLKKPTSTVNPFPNLKKATPAGIAFAEENSLPFANQEESIKCFRSEVNVARDKLLQIERKRNKL